MTQRPSPPGQDSGGLYSRALNILGGRLERGGAQEERARPAVALCHIATMRCQLTIRLSHLAVRRSSGRLNGFHSNLRLLLAAKGNAFCGEAIRADARREFCRAAASNPAILLT